MSGEQTKQHLRPCPDRVRNLIPLRRVAVAGETVDAVGRGAREQRGTLVDLIERIGNDHRGTAAGRVDDRLRKREQRLAAAEHRQHLRRRIERCKSVASHEPRGDGFAQRGRSCRCGIIREPAAARAQRVADELRRRVPGFADRKADGRPAADWA